MSSSGTLYIVATPIGNLSDISSRAIEILAAVDKIAAEDTRHSKPLLDKLGISSTIFSYHDYSSDDAASNIVKELQEGASIALISDAGTPLISDPGYKLVRLAREAGIRVLPIPGASSVTAALSVSGLPTDRFLFEGFLPSKRSARQKRLQELIKEERTAVFFESTHRITDCLEDFVAILPQQRRLFIAREITKKFESHFLGNPDQCFNWLQEDANQQKGEFVLVVEGCDISTDEDLALAEALRIVLLLEESLSTKQAISLACQITGIRKNKLYEAVLARTSNPDEP